MPDSSHSISSKDVASAISLYDQSIYTNNRSTNLDLDQRSMSPSNIASGEDRITRTNSGCSITSGASMIATKDGIQGINVKRDGIPKYSLNLLNSMVRKQYDHNNGTKSPTPKTSNMVDPKNKKEEKKRRMTRMTNTRYRMIKPKSFTNSTPLPTPISPLILLLRYRTSFISRKVTLILLH
ncbi:ANL_collapsed_G0015280.mRNA.1.CDS.1 [Saccharomyces cerevisiae]|nr:ANL_collapsed_G0015280.mRNA.1.CDS.1 [Saccharomyces cerevisiae]